MKMNHPGFFNKNPSAEEPVNVKTVMPPEDEKEFVREMSSAVNENPVPREQLAPLKKETVEINTKKKNAFEKLVFLQEPLEKDFVLGDTTFTIQILNSDLNAKVMFALNNLPEEDKISKSHLCLVAACVTKIDGFLIEDAYDGPPADDSYYKRYEVMRNWNIPLIKSLSKKYNTFSDEIQSDYDKDFLDKSPKTPSTE